MFYKCASYYVMFVYTLNFKQFIISGTFVYEYDILLTLHVIDQSIFYCGICVLQTRQKQSIRMHINMMQHSER